MNVVGNILTGSSIVTSVIFNSFFVPSVSKFKNDVDGDSGGKF